MESGSDIDVEGLSAEEQTTVVVINSFKGTKTRNLTVGDMLNYVMSVCYVLFLFCFMCNKCVRPICFRDVNLKE